MPCPCDECVNLFAGDGLYASLHITSHPRLSTTGSLLLLRNRQPFSFTPLPHPAAHCD